MDVLFSGLQNPNKPFESRYRRLMISYIQTIHGVPGKLDFLARVLGPILRNFFL